jgi:hypothetical protein
LGDLDAFLRSLCLFGLEFRQNAAFGRSRIVKRAGRQRLRLVRQGRRQGCGAGEAKKASQENASLHGLSPS